ncbi:MAG: SDR family oxidoreductase, partial [Dehalococcoidia bacterium]|nr:SDR family oxidoreductase [Dehalococcoidia bacterium]
VVVNDLGGEADGSGESHTPADQVVKEIKDAGGHAVTNYNSVTDFQAAKKIIDSAIDTFGRLDILVNNAGFLRDRMTFKMSEEEFDSVIAVHLKGTFNCGRWACLYFYEQSKAGSPVNGRLINTVSHAGLGGNPSQGNYASAKGGIASLTMVWGREMAKYNVTSNAVAPMARSRMTLGAPMTAQMMGEKPPEDGSFDTFAPENLSPLIAYLASDAAQDITGRIFTVFGGKVQVFIPWTPGNFVDIGRQWTVKELGERIHELGDLSMPPFPM